MTRCLKTLFAVCIDNGEHPASPEVHKAYRVVPDKDAERNEDLRVIDQSGEDYLHPGSYFVEIDVPQETGRVLMEAFERA